MSAINLKIVFKKASLFSFTSLSIMLLSLDAFSQGDNMSNPFIMGTYDAGTYNYSDSRNTANYNNDYGNSSADVFYRFTINNTATVNISTCSSGWDTYLWLLDANGNEVIHDDDNGGACQGLTASIVIPSSQTTLTSLPAGTYYIVAEGYSGNVGIVNLSVSLTVEGTVSYNTKNFVRTWDATAPQTDPNVLMSSGVKEVKQSTTYFDGLGRPDQSVVKQGSWNQSNGIFYFFDLVTPFKYDEFGRETKKYLPYVGNSGEGDYYEDATTSQLSFNQTFYSSQNENTFYGQTDYERSPLNRVIKQMAPGESWAGSGRGVSTAFYINTPTDAVRIWNVTDVPNGFGTYSSPRVYDPGTLYKTITADEQQHQVIEFKDKDGKVILKKVQFSALSDDGPTGSGHSGWLCTYYIYDDLGQLRAVIQPNAVEELNKPSVNWQLSGTMLDELCFRYEYDSRGRTIIKKVPGAAAVQMVYDQRDRLIMTQDGNLRAQQKWSVTVYENSLNRAASTYLITDLSSSTTEPNNTTNASNHRSAASSSISYPPISNYANELLTQTHYDDYTLLPSGLYGTLYNSGYGSYLSASSGSPDYAEPMTQSTAVKGLATWTTSKVLNSSPTQYISSCNIYDEKGRVLQNQSINVTGGLDVATNQYSFSGQVLRNHVKHQKAGTNPQSYDVATQNGYDEWQRLINVSKNVNNSGWHQTFYQNYNPLGHLKQKVVGPTVNGGLEVLNYDYNVRGWLLGVNRDFAMTPWDGSHYFGFDLGYDKTAIFRSDGSAVLPGYNQPAYNGNITGTIWKSKGDNVLRRYDFTYDNVNRLTGAAYLQHSTADWNNTEMDYSVSNLGYDANGNILSMKQRGWKGTGNINVDWLTYNYYPYSNKLSGVSEDASIGAANLNLGDFTDYNTTGNDYGYDLNGNLISDLNKRIVGSTGIDLPNGGGITYNYLNLPQQISVKDGLWNPKGSVEYVYDATGNKLKKIVHENGQPDKTTLYLFGTYENDVLQFLPQEEGRIRLRTSDNTFQYDYFIKDHLGNVRMVLTEEQQTNYYPASTFEGDQTDHALSMINWEKFFFTIDNTKITATSSITGWSSSLDYQNNNGNPPYNSVASATYPSNYTVTDGGTSSKMYKTNANSNKTALGFVVKVMAGDVVNIFGKSYYYAPATTFDNSNSTAMAVYDIFTGLLGTPGNPVSAKGIGEANLETLNSGNYTLPANLVRGNDGSASSSPKAYINYIILDDQLRYVTSGFSRVGSSGTVKNHWNDASMQNIGVPKNGYLYVYVSNESNQDVYFDNLQVVHVRGPILEESHYYPFGLVMQGISSTAIGFAQPQNKRKFNAGSELQNNEYSDGSGLEMYDTRYRGLDPQIGRWWQTDPKPTYEFSPYSAFDNNPIRYNDPLGDTLPKSAGSIRYFPNSVSGTPWNQNTTTSGGSWPGSQKGGSGVHPTTNQTSSKKTNREYSDEPLLGATNTNVKETGHVDLVPTTLGDEARVTNYTGTVGGKEGKLATIDVSTTDLKVDGITATIGPLSVGLTTGGIKVGLSAFGYEGHIVAGGPGHGLGEFGVGGSHTDANNVIGGWDFTVKPGGGALLGAGAAVILSPFIGAGAAGAALSQ